MNYCDFFLGLLTASFSAALGSALTYYTGLRKARAERKACKQAMALILSICVDDCLRYANSCAVYSDYGKWTYKLWLDSQLEIAKALPHEYSIFANIISSLGHIDGNTNIKSLLSSLQTLQTQAKSLCKQ